MIVRPARRLCATSLAVLTLGASLAHAQATPEAAIAQAEAMGLCDPTLPAGVRMPGRLIGCTPQQAARMGIPAGTTTGMAGGGASAPRSGGGLTGGAGPGGISIGGGDPLNMGGPLPGPKGPGAPKGPSGGPLPTGPMAGGPSRNDVFDRAAADRYRAELAARKTAGAQEAADADAAYNQMEADVLEAAQAGRDSAEARAADKKMRAEMAKLRAQRALVKKEVIDRKHASFEECKKQLGPNYEATMEQIAMEYQRSIRGAKPELIVMLKQRKSEAEAAAKYEFDQGCDHLDPDLALAPLTPKDSDEDLLAPLTPKDNDDDLLAPLTPPKKK